LLNVTATALFASAWVVRKTDRSAGRVLARVGYGVSLAAAYLGGNLVFSRQIGVDHAAGQTLPTDFVPVMRADDLPEQQMRRVEVGEVKVLLVKQRGRIHALAETCAHLGGPLSEGTLEDGAVVCPWHGSRYALEDGAVLDGPSTHPQTCFDVRISEEGMIELRTPEHGV
jgi:nitrite reductase/ring-hydroxylating ferredoxin subunit